MASHTQARVAAVLSDAKQSRALRVYLVLWAVLFICYLAVVGVIGHLSTTSRHADDWHLSLRKRSQAKYPNTLFAFEKFHGEPGVANLSFVPATANCSGSVSSAKSASPQDAVPWPSRSYLTNTMTIHPTTCPSPFGGQTQCMFFDTSMFTAMSSIPFNKVTCMFSLNMEPGEGLVHFQLTDASVSVNNYEASTFHPIAPSGHIDITTSEEHYDTYSKWPFKIVYHEAPSQNRTSFLVHLLIDDVNERIWKKWDPYSGVQAAADMGGFAFLLFSIVLPTLMFVVGWFLPADSNLLSLSSSKGLHTDSTERSPLHASDDHGVL